MANYLLFENGDQITLENDSGNIMLQNQSSNYVTPLSSFNNPIKTSFISNTTIGGTVIDDVNG